jgi:hypothetical protein
MKLELANVSKAPIKVRYNSHVSFNITYLVRNDAGNVISSFNRATLLSGYFAYHQALRPGEPLVWNDYLYILQEYCRPKLEPGKYHLEAVFQNGEFRARSGQLRIVVGPDVGKKDGQAIWQLDRQ